MKQQSVPVLWNQTTKRSRKWERAMAMNGGQSGADEVLKELRSANSA